MTSRGLPSPGCTTEPRPPGRRRRGARAGLVALLLAGLLTGLLSACLGREDDVGAGDLRGALGDGSQAGPAPGPTEAGLVRRAQRLLDARARAVRTGDEAAFVRQLGPGPVFRARQLRWFRSVVQLPWQRFDYEVLDTTWDVPLARRWGEVVRVPTVVQRTRLRGFDARVVERDIGLAVSFDGPRPRVVGDRGPDGDPMLRGTPAPWDLTAVQVRRSPGVLGVFDARSVSDAPAVMAAVSDGIDALGPLLPFAWPGRVVVYHVSDPAVLASFTDVPGGSIDLLGALTFPTYSLPEVSPVASVRMLVLPTSVAAGEPFLGRIVRHELAHVALGERDDGAPTWFAEGLAEYLGAAPLARGEQQIPTVAVERATTPPEGMPGSESFNGPEQDWHYALSWMALDQVVQTRGGATLWRLLDGFEADPVGRGDRGQDRVLRRVLGYDSAELARRGAERIRSVYG